jgi:hypothetical protein
MLYGPGADVRGGAGRMDEDQHRGAGKVSRMWVDPVEPLRLSRRSRVAERSSPVPCPVGKRQVRGADMQRRTERPPYMPAHPIRYYQSFRAV